MNLTENSNVLSDTQKLDIVLQNQQAIQEDLGYLRENITLLCTAMQDLVDKLQPPGIPTRPNVAPTKQLQQTNPAPQAPNATINVKTMEDVVSAFPQAIADKLDFGLRNAGKQVNIKPKEFLGSQTFKDINSTVRAMGGQYISAKADSHFEVPLRSN